VAIFGAGWGIKAQGLEGEILRKVMVEGVKLGISSLPVHDALAVNHEHADWAQEAMTTNGCLKYLLVVSHSSPLQLHSGC